MKTRRIRIGDKVKALPASFEIPPDLVGRVGVVATSARRLGYMSVRFPGWTHGHNFFSAKFGPITDGWFILPQFLELIKSAPKKAHK